MTQKRRIRLDEARPGMFVTDVFNAEGVLLLSQNRPLTNESQIERLRKQGVTTVLIDPDQGSDPNTMAADLCHRLEIIFESSATTPAHPPLPTEDLAEETPEPPDHRLLLFEKELEIARRVYEQAVSILTHLFKDIRLGKSLKDELLNTITTEMVDSILRNEEALCSLVRLKNYDEYTFTHSVNVAILSISMGRALNLERKALFALGRGGLLHDIGKMRIAPEILNKPGLLTPEEEKIMREHPLHGVAILKELAAPLESDFIIVAQHHERHNGSGYPYHLSGEQLHLYGVLTAISDVYDAMTTERVYRKAHTPQEALAEIFMGTEDSFPKPIISLFTRTLGIYPVGSTVRLSTGELAVVKHVERRALLSPSVILVRDERGIPFDPPRLLHLDEDAEQRRILASINPFSVGINVSDYLDSKSS